MTPNNRNRLGLALRILVSAALVGLLTSFRAFAFPLFYFGLALFVLVGMFHARRVRRPGPWLDWVNLYLALFLVPPGLIGWTFRIPWSISGLAVALAAAVAAYVLGRRVLPAVVALSAVLAITAGLATMWMYAPRSGSSPRPLPGEAAAIDRTGIADVGGQMSRGLFSFAPYSKIPGRPEPTNPGDPPAGAVMALLGFGPDEFTLRPFVGSPGFTLEPSVFSIDRANPVRDIDFDRVRRHWLILCGDDPRLVTWGRRDEGVIAEASGLGIWPAALEIHQQLDRAYIIDPALGRLIEFDLELAEPLRRRFVGFGADDIAVSPDDLHLFVADPYLGRVRVFDVVTLEWVANIPLRFGVAHLALDREHHRLFAATLPGGALFAIDTDTNAVVARATLGGPVLDMEFDALSRRVFWMTPYGPRWAFETDLFRD